MHTIQLCFPGFKHKVLTMSYDDGRTFDRQLIQIFNKYGIKGTFHLNSGFLGDGGHVTKEEVKSLYEGHEVSCHTYSHPTIARIPIIQTERQILEDREILEDLVGYSVRGLSYPNGSFNEEIKKTLPFLGIEYSRVVGNTDDFAMPSDLYQWKATCHHNHNLMENADRFLKLFKKQYLYMMYVWGHSYEFDTNNNWEQIEEFCRAVSEKDDIWYATNIEIVDYLKLYHNLRFTSKSDYVENPGANPVYLSVDKEEFEIKGGARVKLF